MTLHPSIRIEGGLLGPEVLDQLMAGELPGQKAADFGLSSRRNLTDEIAAVFADARAMWGVFQHRLARLPEDDLATTVTRDAWVIPFLGLLGYEPQYNPRAHEVDGLKFAISHRAAEAEDSPPIHIVGSRQELGRVPATGRPRMAPHSLLQEYLNRTEHLWGLVTNGEVLRLLRDSTFVRRQSYVEFDLKAILEEQRFEDFAALYRLLHRTRLPQSIADAPACLLEKYHDYSIEQGGRVREHLRDGVEECIKRLANGFLRCSGSGELRRRVSRECTGNDCITAADFYHELLRLVYRFLFLLVCEDRGLLSADPIYREHYGIARLRRLTEIRAAYTEHTDLWQSLRVLWVVLTSEPAQPSLNNQPMASALGLPVLNGELFAPLKLDEFAIGNRDLLEALWHLAYYQERPSQPPRRVNYAALDVEELGSVYESLLEFHPHVAGPTNAPTFDLLLEGGERRSTGSHYTPPELVAPLIQHALEPVLAERLREATTDEQKQRIILSMKVCDPACGSGHFLLAAARRLGKELARARTGEDEPAPERVREAIRDVVTHCIYGVDKNPLAVELCRVALWLESHEGGKPLTFLDHRIRCGDSLVGVFDLNMLEGGIPDEAYKPV
ncbi:MAG TPA: DNA methyltransferase, partial [Phycisphaerae bacterium]|nr:DNA methyltransferase [Phycisphaerae bacterium]